MPGTYEVIATATNSFGISASDSSSNELIISINTGPTAPTVNNQTTTDTTPTLTGTYDAANATGGFSVTVNGVIYTLGDGNLTASGNNWSLTIPAGNALGEGSYDVIATATDSLGMSISDSSSNELVIGTSTITTTGTVRTGIRGVGGCTFANGPGDPMLPVLLALSIIGASKKYLLKLWRGR